MKISLSVALGGLDDRLLRDDGARGSGVLHFQHQQCGEKQCGRVYRRGMGCGEMVSLRGFLREWWRCGSFFWRMREALEWLDGEDSALTRKVQSGKEQS